MTHKATGILPLPPAHDCRRLAQGVILGGLIEGIKVENGAFAGGPFDWATPFALLCGLGVTVGYALLGAGFLIMRTEEGAAASFARHCAPISLVAVMAAAAAVSLWTPLAVPRIAWPGYVHNSAVVISPTRGVLGVHHKVSLPTFHIGDLLVSEGNYWSPGTQFPLFKIRGWGVGVNICAAVGCPRSHAFRQ